MAIVICSAASEASGPTRPTITIEREDSSAITVPGVANAPTSATYTTQSGRFHRERRQERRQHLRDQQFRRRNRRRQQRLERPPLLFADNAVGGERDGADNRRDEKEQQKLLKQECLQPQSLEAGAQGAAASGRRAPRSL